MNNNPFEILKNVKLIKEQISGIQDRINAITVTGTAGGGMVEIDINGKMEVMDVRISQEAMNDREMLQDLIYVAFKNGMSKINEEIQSESINQLGGFDLSNIPGFNA